MRQQHQLSPISTSTGTTCSHWDIHSNYGPRCTAASASSSVSVWDTTTHKQIGSVIQHPAAIKSIAVQTTAESTQSSFTVSVTSFPHPTLSMRVHLTYSCRLSQNGSSSAWRWSLFQLGFMFCARRHRAEDMNSSATIATLTHPSGRGVARIA